MSRLYKNREFWNQSMVDCYKIGCNCKICKTYETYFAPNRTCCMKNTIKESIKKYGLPKKLIREDRENFIND